jgi:hypothetical protein
LNRLGAIAAAGTVFLAAQVGCKPAPPLNREGQCVVCIDFSRSVTPSIEERLGIVRGYLNGLAIPIRWELQIVPLVGDIGYTEVTIASQTLERTTQARDRQGAANLQEERGGRIEGLLQATRGWFEENRPRIEADTATCVGRGIACAAWALQGTDSTAHRQIVVLSDMIEECPGLVDMLDRPEAADSLAGRMVAEYGPALLRGVEVTVYVLPGSPQASKASRMTMIRRRNIWGETLRALGSRSVTILPWSGAQPGKATPTGS